MIKNISDGLVHLKWGGESYFLSPNQMLKVEDMFSVKGKEIQMLEDRFIHKFLGKVERVEDDAPKPIVEVKAPEIAIKPPKKGIKIGIKTKKR